VARMFRAQILLEPGQHHDLEQLARSTGRSTSDLVREIVGEYLSHRSAEESRRRAGEALSWLAASRQVIEAAHGTVPESFLRNMREDRDTDLAAQAEARP
jgi:predicted DNA-binding protein